ncbi:hypothetical protein [Georgenia faecalis]|uniref:hypothetical protein n=1 Tax=Georgenia faecalis TaxID=2483799 RepID=UPI0019D310D6|nr:hypothetical protein [Georgenia faecalis]
MTDHPNHVDPDDADLDALVDQVLGQRPRPINWSELPSEDLEEQWEALDRWVRWLVSRYALDHRDIPACWYTHGDLVEELSALRTAHHGAFDPSGPASGPAEWHQILANTRARLQLWVARTGCRPAEHRPPVGPTWADEPAPRDYQRAFHAYTTTTEAAAEAALDRR